MYKYKIDITLLKLITYTNINMCMKEKKRNSEGLLSFR